MTHELKIMQEYALAKLRGEKMFEIRKNDRIFRVGDYVVYTCTDDKSLNDDLAQYTYRITYVCNYNQKKGYVVFGEEAIPGTAGAMIWRDLQAIKRQIRVISKHWGVENLAMQIASEVCKYLTALYVEKKENKGDQI